MAQTDLLFSYFDKNQNEELWLYDGTRFVDFTAGLSSQSGGLFPSYLDAYDGALIFQGTNAAGLRSMWVSDGTKSGTHAVTGIHGANPDGLNPLYFTNYGGKILFDGASGYAGAPVYGLWVTKGTGATTVELGGSGNHQIKNVNSQGLLAYCNGFTVFKGLAYFDGYDKAGNIGLWRTNGTVSGTIEIAPITGAAQVGTPGTDIQPKYRCVVGTKMFFAGADQTDAHYGLWATDGTAKGTIEIGGQGNKGIKGSPYQNAMNLTIGMGPTAITAFKGKALFAATDNTVQPNGYYAHTVGMWLSDGTAAGTVEIGGHGSSQIAHANKALDGGLFDGIDNPDFTVFGGKVLFVGRDNDSSGGHVGLWVTDGTVAGTLELGGLDNAGIAGKPVMIADEKTPDLTVFNHRVYFTALDGASNEWHVWSTNGTAAGTHMVSGTSTYASPNTDFTSLTH